jgi:hypothetical protein
MQHTIEMYECLMLMSVEFVVQHTGVTTFHLRTWYMDIVLKTLLSFPQFDH